jgi:hypothetical protein
MEKQTAIQEMIEDLDCEFKERGISVNWDVYLQREKENIIEICIKIIKETSLFPLEDDVYRPDAEQYYNNTYGKQ